MKTKICIHSDCPFGYIPQPISNFCKDKTKPDGHHTYCKTCRTRIARIRMEDNPSAKEKNRQAQIRYRNTEHGNKKQKKYYLEHKSEYREREKSYQQRPDVKAKHAEKMKKYRQRNKPKERARQVINYAIKKGYIAKPSICDWCKKPANGILEIHHWKGYAVSHWFDVKFVHSKCHDLVENLSPKDW